jgi:hypothetical protein
VQRSPCKRILGANNSTYSRDCNAHTALSTLHTTPTPPTPPNPSQGRLLLVPSGCTSAMGAFLTKSLQWRGMSSASTTGSTEVARATCRKFQETMESWRVPPLIVDCEHSCCCPEKVGPFAGEQLCQLHCTGPVTQRSLEERRQRRRKSRGQLLFLYCCIKRCGQRHLLRRQTYPYFTHGCLGWPPKNTGLVRCQRTKVRRNTTAK